MTVSEGVADRFGSFVFRQLQQGRTYSVAWTTVTAPKQSTLGTRNIYLVFSSGQSGDFVNVDWFKFTG